MRIIIMFDLPSVTNKEVKLTNKWRKFLIRNGFYMMTESVYSRLAINKSVSSSIKNTIKENLPPNGDIQMLEITEKQYAEIEYYLGKNQTNVVHSIERYIEL